MPILVLKISPDKLAAAYDGPNIDRTAPETALDPVPAEPAPGTLKSVPEFRPLPVKQRAGKVNLSGRNWEPLALFLLYWPLELVQLIVINTNSYAARHEVQNDTPKPRRWTPFTVKEFYLFLGCIIYMGLNPLHLREAYWRPIPGPSGGTHALPLHRTRFEQLWRYLCIEDLPGPLRPKPWYLPVKSLLDHLRKYCLEHYTPGSSLTVDEGMFGAYGRSKHTVKMPNKPIPQGLKFWSLCDHGYTCTLRLYSKIEKTEALGPRNIPYSDECFVKKPPKQPPKQSQEAKKKRKRKLFLADTQALMVELVKDLNYRDYLFTLYLDNLFTNQPLFSHLRALGIGATGTVRANALGYHPRLVGLKNSLKPLFWGSTQAEIIGDVLCWL
jgi:Transposase IS4